MKGVITALAASFFVIPAVQAGEITSKITDSVQLTVDGPAVQSIRMGSSYTVSGDNISVTTLGGLTGGSATGPATVSAGTYGINTDGQSFSFSESTFIGDTVVTSQSALDGTTGAIDGPNLYSNSTSSLGGTKGSLAGTLSSTGIPSVTAGGVGTTAIGQRTVELSVFK